MVLPFQPSELSQTPIAPTSHTVLPKWSSNSPRSNELRDCWIDATNKLQALVILAPERAAVLALVVNDMLHDILLHVLDP